MNNFDKKVLFVHDFHFYLDEESNLYTAVGLPEVYFDRFFDAGITSVYIFTRFRRERRVTILSHGYTKINNQNIKPFLVIEGYRGLFNIANVFSFIKKSKNINYFVISTPSIIGFWVNSILIFIRKKYSLEFAGDETMFKTKPFGSVVTRFFSIALPYFSHKSSGATYVSNFLYKTYPNKNYLVASNVNLPDLMIVSHNKFLDRSRATINIVFVGGITKRKGIELIINVAQRLNNGRILVNFFLYGGHSDVDWAALIQKQGLIDVVHLMGIKKPEEIFKMLNGADIYVQPSYSEGLPRATIEAMSQGLPVVATNLPGFVELLDPLVLFPPGDLDNFHLIVNKLIFDKDFYIKQSKRNLKFSKDFSYEKLHRKRVDFYKGIFK
jgi:glycosyltransferase involved in cell wall biosynthesis